MSSALFSNKVTKFLDDKKVEYKLVVHSKPVFTVEEAAKERGIIKHEMVKSIVVTDGKDVFLACVPGDKRLDLEKLRSFLKCGTLSLARAPDVMKFTGYEVGAVTPLLLEHPVRIVFDLDFKYRTDLSVSTGSHDAGVILSSKDLFNLVNPEFAMISC
ncbi:MAG: YbaK/EbsC family protein [archaeon]